jgi:hypothetical protein
MSFRGQTTVHPQDWPAVIVIMPAWCTGWASAACPVSAPNRHSHLDCGPVVAVAQPSPGNQEASCDVEYVAGCRTYDKLRQDGWAAMMVSVCARCAGWVTCAVQQKVTASAPVTNNHLHCRPKRCNTTVKCKGGSCDMHASTTKLSHSRVEHACSMWWLIFEGE